MQYVLLGALVVVILMACMFPAWPLWAKLGVWCAGATPVGRPRAIVGTGRKGLISPIQI